MNYKIRKFNIHISIQYSYIRAS